jgi:hypothetical protein
MLSELWRVLRPGGLLFTRIGSRIGMDFEPLGNGLYRTGDGSAWFLVDEAMLMAHTAQWNAKTVVVDPLKTTIVQNSPLHDHLGPAQTLARCAPTYGNSRTQIFRKLIGSLLSPCACSLIGAPSNAL